MMLQDGGVMPYIHEWGRMLHAEKGARYERARLRAVRANAPVSAQASVQCAIDMLNDSLASNVVRAEEAAIILEIHAINEWEQGRDQDAFAKMTGQESRALQWHKRQLWVKRLLEG